MIQVAIDVEDKISPRLKEFGKRAPTIMRRICRTVGQNFRAFTKKNYLRGQVIGKRTGALWKDFKIVNDRRDKQAVIVRPSARLASIYHKPGGATILPRTKKALKFEVNGVEVFTRRVHLRERSWMPRARTEFQWNMEIEKAADKVIERELKKLEEKYGTG